MRYGHGIRVWADGRRYEGEWRDDTYFTGVATFPDGDRVEWRNCDPVA